MGGSKKGPKAAAGSKDTSSKASSSSKAAAGKADKKKQQGGSRKGCRASPRADSSLRDPLDRELALLGLRVKSITADGNCLFRSLSDQLQGDEGAHAVLRARVVELMRERADDFAPFVEDDSTLEQHLARMAKPGCWAGHMELQAASLLLGVNLAVYQAGQPRWCITNHPAGSRMLHLTYEDGSHFNSVRRGDDYSRGQPADVPEAPVAPLSLGDAAQAQAAWSAADEKLVAAGTGCDSALLIRQQLGKAGGDVAAAIEAVVAILAAEEEEAQQPEEQHEEQQEQQQDDGRGAVGAAEGQPEPEQPALCSGDAEESTGQRGSSSSSSGSKAKGVKLQGRAPVVSSKARDKAPGRNRPCPCGSGRRFKHCCAANEGAAKAPAGGGGTDGVLPVAALATLHI